MSVGTGPKATPGKGGFLFQCDVEAAPGKTTTISSDDSWKVITADAWKQDTPRVNFSLGFIEVFDARKDVPNWNEIELSESGWTKALVYANWSDGVAPVEPFTNLVQRDIPFLVEKPVSAERIIESGEVTDASGEVPADQMMQEEIAPLSTSDNSERERVTQSRWQVCDGASSEG